MLVLVFMNSYCMEGTCQRLDLGKAVQKLHEKHRTFWKQWTHSLVNTQNVSVKESSGKFWSNFSKLTNYEYILYTFCFILVIFLHKITSFRVFFFSKGVIFILFLFNYYNLFLNVIE